MGDLFQYWTCGTLKSAVHRVVFPADSKEDRYSIAYFCHPADKSPLEPVPSPIVKDRLENGITESDAQGITTAGEYLKSRLQATYKIS